MGDGDKIIDELAARQNNYLIVRPASRLHSGYEAVNVWNSDVKRSGEKEAVTWWERDHITHSSHFDYVLEVHDAESNNGGPELYDWTCPECGEGHQSADDTPPKECVECHAWLARDE